MSYRLQGQALIMTLGMGFAVAGLVQIITSIGSQFSGNVFGTVPPWLSNLAAMNGTHVRTERAADDSALDPLVHYRGRWRCAIPPMAVTSMRLAAIADPLS